jgi:hypothetical protein
MAIAGMEGMSNEQINFELQQGAKIVRYYYCISVLIMSFRRVHVRFIKTGESRVTPGLPFTLISLFCGWWGIPWGPIWTIQALATNFGGGKDITQDVLNALAPRVASQQAFPQQNLPLQGTPPPPPPNALR